MSFPVAPRTHNNQPLKKFVFNILALRTLSSRFFESGLIFKWFTSLFYNCFQRSAYYSFNSWVSIWHIIRNMLMFTHARFRWLAVIPISIFWLHYLDEAAVEGCFVFQLVIFLILKVLKCAHFEGDEWKKAGYRGENYENSWNRHRCKYCSKRSLQYRAADGI